MLERYSAKMARVWAQVEAWNAAHSVGSKVRVTSEAFSPYETRTRSEMSALASGDTIVQLVNGPIFVAKIEQLEAI